MSAATTTVEILAATVPALGGSYWAYKASTKAAKVASQQQSDAATSAQRFETLRIESKAYERAKEIYESALQQLEHQLDRLHQQLERVNEQLSRERDTSAGLRLQIHTLENQIQTLEQTVAELRRQLAVAPITAANERQTGGGS